MDVVWVNSGKSKRGFKWIEPETINAHTNLPFEAVIDQDNFKQVWWLEKALEASKKVARIKMSRSSATGFLISEDILITNHHVFEHKEDARSASIEFNFQIDISDEPQEKDVWECNPDDLFVTNEQLDYSIVRLKEKKKKKAGDILGVF